MPGITRKESRSLDATQLEKLRNAFKELKAKQGANGYEDIAGVHGDPKRLCPHGKPIFLPWHRAYILAIERALRDIDSDVHLPFWDWTSSESISSGIPDAYSVKEYKLEDATTVPNPLFSAMIGLAGRETERAPREPVILEGYAKQVQLAMDNTTFLGFSAAIEAPHGNLHTWVLGDMGTVKYAAYDPIFWAHHANVDRQWAQWQKSSNNAAPPQSVLDETLEPFGIKVSAVIDYEKDLGYDYEGVSALALKNVIRADESGSFIMEALHHAPRRVLLRAHGLQMSAETFNLDIFINQPDADASTPIAGNRNFAGSIGIFGMGEGMHNHAGGHDIHAAHAHEPGPDTVLNTEQILDITDIFNRVAQEGEEIHIKAVARNAHGEPVDISRIPMEGLSIEER